MKKRNLTYEESYDIGYMEGFRIGQIGTLRKSLIKCLQKKSKNHDFLLSKSLIQKINRETDIPFLSKLLFLAMEDESIESFEESYDRLLLTVDEVLERYVSFNENIIK